MIFSSPAIFQTHFKPFLVFLAIFLRPHLRILLIFCPQQLFYSKNRHFQTSLLTLLQENDIFNTFQHENGAPSSHFTFFLTILSIQQDVDKIFKETWSANFGAPWFRLFWLHRKMKHMIFIQEFHMFEKNLKISPKGKIYPICGYKIDGAT